MANLKIAIVGGGIGGIATAIGLYRQGIKDFDVFEGARSFAEIGAGLNFAPNARSAIAKLGLEKEFDEFSTIISDGYYFEYRLGTDKEHHLVAEAKSKPDACATVHRAKFLAAMLDHMPKDRVHFGKRLLKMKRLPSTAPFPVRLHFQDGTTYEAHLVVGCDGIHSKIREYVNVKGSPRWSGTWAYRALIPIDEFAQAISSERREQYCRIPQMFMDKDRHILTFPIDHHKTINVVAFYTVKRAKEQDLPEGEEWTQTTSQEALLKEFEGWNDDMINVLKCFKNPTKWALHQMEPLLSTYIGDNVALVGDAAHGGVPHQGALAGQAFEDALFLSRVLAQPGVNAENLKHVLPVYDHIRLPRANRVLQTSLEAGEAYEFAGPQGDNLPALAENLSKRWAWIWEHDHDKDAEQAVAWLKSEKVI